MINFGTACSAGCVRLTVADASWIYSNIASGTLVEFYSSADPGPLGKPYAKKISDNTECRDWDPTDPDPNNPWRLHKEPEIVEEQKDEPKEQDDNNTEQTNNSSVQENNNNQLTDNSTNENNNNTVENNDNITGNNENSTNTINNDNTTVNDNTIQNDGINNAVSENSLENII